MLDLKELRKDPRGLEAKLKNKVPEISLAPIMALDERLRALKTETEEFKSKKNQASKEIGMRKQKGEDISKFMEEMTGLGEQISVRDAEIAKVEEDLNHAVAVLPNIPDGRCARFAQS